MEFGNKLQGCGRYLAGRTSFGKFALHDARFFTAVNRAW